MADNNEWRVPSVFTEICELRKECHDLHNENADLHKRNECQAQQLSSLRDDLAQANRDRDKAMNMAEDRQRRMENAEKEVERLKEIEARKDSNTALRREVEVARRQLKESERLLRGQQVRINLQKDKYEKLRDEFDYKAKELDRIIGIAKHRAERITELKGTGNEDSHLAPAQQFMQVKLLEGVPKSVNALHAVGQIIGLLHVSRKDTRNIGHWLINSVREELE